MEEDKPIEATPNTKEIAKVESMKKTLGGLFSNHIKKIRLIHEIFFMEIPKNSQKKALIFKFFLRKPTTPLFSCLRKTPPLKKCTFFSFWVLSCPFFGSWKNTIFLNTKSEINLTIKEEFLSGLKTLKE